MAVRRKHDILIIVVFVLAVIAYGAIRSEFRLRPDMPTEFFDGSGLPPAKRASERKIAEAYWNCAVKQVQWKYGYAHRLPDEPAPEFSVSASEVGQVANDQAIRRYYWQKLGSTWNVSGAWTTQYEWSSNSFRQALRSAGDWWGHLTRNVMGQ
jgi:hypothetical protein